MNPLDDLRGIVTVLNTPFTHVGGVDYDALAAHVEYAVSCGVAGFLVPALASEVFSLTPDERDRILKTVIETSANRAPVIAGCASDSALASAELASRSLDAGANGVLVQVKPKHWEAIRDDLKRIDALKPPLLMVQDWDPAGPGLQVETIVRLFESIDSFRALKVETVPAGPKYTAVIEATDGQLHVSGGWAAGQMIEALDRGVHAFMPTALHAAYTKTYRLFAEGKRKEAAALFRRVQPILAFSNQHLDVSIHFFKRLLHAQGIYPTYEVRAPKTPFDPWHARMAAELIPLALAIEAECRD